MSPENRRHNPSAICCGAAMVRSYPSPGCSRRCAHGSGRGGMGGRVGMMNVILKTWRGSRGDGLSRSVSSGSPPSARLGIFSQHLRLVVTAPVSQMSPTRVFKHTTNPVFISVPCPPPRHCELQDRYRMVRLHSSQRPPCLRTVDTVEELESLAKEHLLKAANEGMSRGARLSTTNHIQRFSIRCRRLKRAQLTPTHPVHLNHILRRVWILPVPCFWF